MLLVCDDSLYRERGIPNYNYVKGRITFARAKSLKVTSEEAMVSDGHY